MDFAGSGRPRPDSLEDITDTRWVKRTAMDEIFANTYPSVVEVINGTE